MRILVLGALGADYFLGGEMSLDVEGARRAIADKIGKPLDLGIMEAAAGIVEVSNSVMVRALRRVSVEKGRLPSDYALVAFGGAGPLQAAYLADDLGVREVIVPPFPGVASAVGLLGSDIRYEYVQAHFGALHSLDPRKVSEILEALAQRGRQDLARSGIAEAAMQFLPSGDLRYIGQAYEIRVGWPGSRVGASDLAEMERRFHSEHQRLYSFATPDRAVESVSLRLTAVAAVDKPESPSPSIGSGQPKQKGKRQAYLRASGLTECPIYERSALFFGQKIGGPAIIEQKDLTTLVVPGWEAESDQHGNLLLTKRNRSQRTNV